MPGPAASGPLTVTAAPRSAGVPLLDVRDLVKHYGGGTVALAGVSLSVRAGELVVVLGANGSGKSTLLRCAARLADPTAGTVVAAGRELAGLSGRELRHARRAVAMIFQRSYLVRRRSAWDNVLAATLGRHQRLSTALGLLPRSEHELAAELLRRVGMLDRAAQRADTLSGGQAQRVAIARALAQRPQVLLADEPVAGLDPDAVTSIMDLLRELAHRDGLAVLCVLHQPELALRYADRLVALQHGRIVGDNIPAGYSQEAIDAIYRDQAQDLG